MHRLLVDTAALEAAEIAPSPDAARHLRAVRAQDGESVEVFDGKGARRICVWDASARVLRPEGEATRSARRPGSLSLFACVTKGSRWDWTVEKAVELGADRIVPVVSARTIVKIAPEDREAKRQRWSRVAADAARQSDAAWLPEILAPAEFKSACALAAKTRCFAGILSNPPPPPLLDALASSGAPRSGDFSLFTGPEGDFTADEIAALLAFARPASFGPAILRAETAAIFGLSVLAAWRSAHGTR